MCNTSLNAAPLGRRDSSSKYLETIFYYIAGTDQGSRQTHRTGLDSANTRALERNKFKQACMCNSFSAQHTSREA
jgi:hypothetical protein